jgi:hypothetical protein
MIVSVPTPVRTQYLDSHSAANIWIIGFVHGSYATLSELLKNLVASQLLSHRNIIHLYKRHKTQQLRAENVMATPLALKHHVASGPLHARG